VTVGDPGNLPDPATGNLYGSVPYVYQMGAYDVTTGQYVAFLNSVATQSDTYGLYWYGMATGLPTIHITQSGSPGSYTYAVTGTAPGAANMPVFDVSWGDGARFCNWLANGQPTSGTEATGTTETGAYTLNGATSNAALMAVTRNVNATYFIPSENEWYKAAYYSGGGTNSVYWTYPTQSNTAPGNSLALALSTSNEANYYISSYTDPTNDLTPVGCFAASPGPYGTYDMGGDVFQWNEAVIYETNLSETDRGFRGGSWYPRPPLTPASSDRSDEIPSDAGVNLGFRVASSAAVPEPGCIALLLAGAMALGIWRLRRNA
jgi:formylglycine-generating enzyme required for sulfatase activity